VNYRESFGIYAVSGILFNHESPRRGLEFVTRKVTHAVARIKRGLQTTLPMAIWPHDATGATAQTTWRRCGGCSNRTRPTTTSSPRARHIPWNAWSKWRSRRRIWTGSDTSSRTRSSSGPAEVDLLIGDATKAKHELGWTPKTSFEDMIKIMVAADLELVTSQQNSPPPPPR